MDPGLGDLETVCSIRHSAVDAQLTAERISFEILRDRRHGLMSSTPQRENVYVAMAYRSD